MPPGHALSLKNDFQVGTIIGQHFWFLKTELMVNNRQDRQDVKRAVIGQRETNTGPYSWGRGRVAGTGRKAGPSNEKEVTNSSKTV